MKLFRSIAPLFLAVIFLGALAFSYAQGQTVIGSQIRVNSQVGIAYTFLCSPPDTGKMVVLSGGSSIAVTLPQAGSSCFQSGWNVYVANAATSATVTITPATSTIAGNTTLAMATGTGVQIISDGTNYQVIK